MLGCITHGYQFMDTVCTKCRDTALGQSTEKDRLRAELIKAQQARDFANENWVKEKAALDEICSQRDRLRDEIAAQRTEARRDARIAETERCRDNAEAALEAANARIAELEAWKATCQEVDCYRVSDARAERAEAERDALHLFSGAQAAVIKEMREALQQLVTDYEDVPGPYDAEGQAVFAKARAALAPFPAGREE